MPKPQVIETDEYGACSSKNVINSLTIPNDNLSSTASVVDDQAIAQLLQAEFDLEFDEEIKRLEQSRNKSNIAKYLKCTRCSLEMFFFRFEDFNLIGEISFIS